MLVVAPVLAVVLAACAGPGSERSATPVATPPSTPTSLWSLDFDGSSPWGKSGAGTVSGIPVAGGQLDVVRSWDGSNAVKFPGFGTDAGFVLIVSDGQSGIASPGEADFGLGADVRIDGHAASASDNGDNVVQRGLASGSAQMKLQIDRGYASCVVKGSGRTLVAKLRSALEPGRWYRMICTRTVEDVTLEIIDLETGDRRDARILGRVGSVDFPESLPFSVGRKVDSLGVPIVNDSDQFNGSMDNIWVSYSAC